MTVACCPRNFVTAMRGPAIAPNIRVRIVFRTWRDTPLFQMAGIMSFKLQAFRPEARQGNGFMAYQCNNNRGGCVTGAITSQPKSLILREVICSGSYTS